MLFFGKKPKQIVVSPVEGKLIWKVPFDASLKENKNAELSTTPGCGVVYYVNNAYRATYENDGVHIINSSKEKNIRSCSLIGYISDKPFSFLFGVGDIPYTDYEISCATKVGMHGSYLVRIQDAAILYRTLGKEEVVIEDVAEYVRGHLAGVAANELAKQLARYSYSTINGSLGEMSKNMSKAFDEEVRKYGLIIDSITVEGINFSDEYQKARKEHFDKIKQDEEDKKTSRQERRRHEEELEIISALKDSGAQNGNPPSEEKKEEKREERKGRKEAASFCPRCGNPVQDGDDFCPKCGKSIKK